MNGENYKVKNETFEPSEAMKALGDSPSFKEHMEKVRTKHEFQEKYGDHPDSRIADNINEYLPPENFVKKPDLKPRTGQEQEHPIQFEESEARKEYRDPFDSTEEDGNSFGSASEFPPDKYI